MTVTVMQLVRVRGEKESKESLGYENLKQLSL